MGGVRGILLDSLRSIVFTFLFINFADSTVLYDEYGFSRETRSDDAFVVLKLHAEHYAAKRQTQAQRHLRRFLKTVVYYYYYIFNEYCLYM